MPNVARGMEREKGITAPAGRIFRRSIAIAHPASSFFRFPYSAHYLHSLIFSARMYPSHHIHSFVTFHHGTHRFLWARVDP